VRLRTGYRCQELVSTILFDLWAEQWRGREARGDMIMVRYADDVVLGFEYEADAQRFLEAMKARLEKFSLALHPEKTRLIAFGRFAADRRAREGLGKPETFDFLGFTFMSGKTRQGQFLVKRKSRRDRVKAKLREIKDTLRSKMHLPVAEQGSWLGQVVRGYFAYHAVPSNLRSLVAFHNHVINLWQRTLARRSQKGRITRLEMTRLVTQWLPQPRIQHPWPNQRFAVKYPRWKPYAGKPHVRFCAGGA
jgi:RNA-directed DNA polymerase